MSLIHMVGGPVGLPSRLRRACLEILCINGNDDHDGDDFVPTPSDAAHQEQFTINLPMQIITIESCQPAHETPRCSPPPPIAKPLDLSSIYHSHPLTVGRCHLVAQSLAPVPVQLALWSIPC